MGIPIENKKEFEFANILYWHSLGYTGKGIKVAGVEHADASLSIFDGKLHYPPYIYESPHAWNSHGQKFYDFIHQVAPDADMYVVPFNFEYIEGYFHSDFMYAGINFIEKEDIHLVGASIGGYNDPTFNEAIRKCIYLGTTFTTSAGNKGEEGLTPFADSGMWLPVGSVGYNERKQKILQRHYSSQGAKLFVVDFDGLFAHNAKEQGKYIQTIGTSFSHPIFLGKLALVQDFFLKNAGRTLYTDELKAFVASHVVDLGIEGRDEEYGYGLFVLPDPYDIDIDKYLFRNIPKKESKTKVVQMDTTAKIIDGRFHVPARFLIEALGGTIKWIASEELAIATFNGKEIYIRKDNDKLIIKEVTSNE